MVKRLFVILVVPVAFAVLLTLSQSSAFVAVSLEVRSRINVPNDYSNIQDAVNAANVGDTVTVSSRTYYEHVVLNKSLMLVGENRGTTIIDGNGTGNVILIAAENVSVSGFTVKNGGDSGILVENDNASISCNIITENARNDYGAGVFLNRSSYASICGNTISGNGHPSGLRWGCGIDCYQSSCVIIDSNLAFDNVVGGILLNANHSVVKQNNATNNGCGIIVAGYYNSISDNRAIANNSTGIFLSYASYSLVKNNICSNNGYYDVFGGPNGGGITLYYSGFNIVEDNLAADNVDWGIDLSDINSYNIIRDNVIMSNPYGLHFHYSNDTTIYHNNFINNGKNADVGDAYPDVETWDNGAEGNYWSNFTGADSNLDGIIDSPYVLDVRNRDNFPLVEPWSETRTHSIMWSDTVYNVTTSCNSTVAGFSFSQPNKQVGFNVTGPANSTGVCNVTVPLSLMWGYFSVLIDNVPRAYAIYQNATHMSIYFTVPFQSTRQVRVLSTGVVPENPLLALISVLVALSTVLIYLKRTHARRHYVIRSK